MTFIIRKGLFFVTVIFIAASAALAAGPAESPVSKEAAVLARIGDTVFTEKDLDAQIQGFPEEFRNMLQDPVRRKAFVEQIARKEAFAMAARDEKMDETEDVREKLDESAKSVLSQVYLQKTCPTPPDPAPEEIEAYYKAHEESFRRGDMVRARHILIQVPEDAGEDAVNQAQEKAKTVRKQVDSGESFWKLAREFSDDPVTKFKGGDLGYFTRERMEKPLSDAAFSMKKGDTSDPVRSVHGFHIIQVEDVRPGETQELSAAASRIRVMMVQEKQRECIEKVFEKLKEKYHIEIMP
ncbi:MAG TPA: peptidylprolyl isomerase [Syntrophales bacterium]|nr:peptidylprolyl isomerase [Syntrophales bacterium]